MREPVVEDAGHTHANELNQRDAENDATRNPKFVLDVLDQLVHTVFGCTGSNRALVVLDDRDEVVIGPATMVGLLEAGPALVTHQFPNHLAKFSGPLADGAGGVVGGVRSGSNEHEKAAEDDRDQEADEQEEEEDA